MMKKLYVILFVVVALFLLRLGCTRVKKLRCNVDIEILKENIKSITNADTVIIYTKRLREEIYFTEIRTPVIIIENATTKTLDFKALPIDKYQRFDGDYHDIETSLKKEGYIIAKQIINNCDTANFNDIIIEFFKRDSSGEPMYHFIFHYDEFLGKKEPKKLVCNTNIDILKKDIKSVTNADTVLIYTQQFDIYLHKIVAPVIVIENATMKSLDFKMLSTDKYQGFGSVNNYHEINDALKTEGYVFVKQLTNSCNMKGFHDGIVVDFIKRDSLDYPMYHFRCLYNEVLNR